MLKKHVMPEETWLEFWPALEITASVPHQTRLDIKNQTPPPPLEKEK